MKNTAYNMPQFLTIGEEVEREKLEAVFKQLIVRHESLRTAFEIVNEEPVQRIYQDLDIKIEYFESFQDKKDIIIQFVRPFELSRAPLLRVGIITLNDGRMVMMIDMHHIITDGTSQIILTTEFHQLYGGQAAFETSL